MQDLEELDGLPPDFQGMDADSLQRIINGIELLGENAGNEVNQLFQRLPDARTALRRVQAKK